MDTINFYKKVPGIFKLKTLKYTVQIHILNVFVSSECDIL